MQGRDKVGDMIVQLDFDTSSHWPLLNSWTSSQFKLFQCRSIITRNPHNISLFHFNVFCLWQECRFFNSWNAFCLQSGENGFIDVLAEGENHASLINNNINDIIMDVVRASHHLLNLPVEDHLCGDGSWVPDSLGHGCVASGLSVLHQVDALQHTHHLP